MAGSGIGLLDLPAEVRVQIYQHLFAGADLSIEPAFPAVSHCGYTICQCHFPRAILVTCRTLRDEAWASLLAAATLTMNSTSQKLDLLPPFYLAGIPKLVVLNVGQYLKRPPDLNRFAALKTLELHNIAIWCRYHKAEDLCGESGEQIMLDLSIFNIKRHGAALAALCASTERLFNILLHCRFVITSADQETLVGRHCHWLTKCSWYRRMQCSISIVGE